MFQIAMIEDEEHTRQEVERLISREFEKLKVQDIKQPKNFWKLRSITM